jgi:hypothetical protein
MSNKHRVIQLASALSVIVCTGYGLAGVTCPRGDQLQAISHLNQYTTTVGSFHVDFDGGIPDITSYRLDKAKIGGSEAPWICFYHTSVSGHPSPVAVRLSVVVQPATSSWSVYGGRGACVINSPDGTECAVKTS